MAMKKTCGCLSLRLGTLIFLPFFMIYILLKLFAVCFFSMNDPELKQMLAEFNPFVITAISIWVIQILILLATVISISNQTPSIFLIWTSIVIVLWYVLLSIHGIIEPIYLLIWEDVHFSSQQKAMHAAITAISTLMIYAVFVFYSYIVELKKQAAHCAPNREIVDEKETKLRLPAYTIQLPEKGPLYPQIQMQYP